MTRSTKKLVNPNPLFTIAEEKDPLIYSKASLHPLQIKPTLVYHFKTDKGDYTRC